MLPDVKKQLEVWDTLVAPLRSKNNEDGKVAKDSKQPADPKGKK